MSIDTSLSKTYWNDFQVTDHDIEFLYSCLLEIETPQTSFELITSLVSKRIEDEIEKLNKTQAGRGSSYLPKETYAVGTRLVFPAMEWKSGQIVDIRDGVNPDITPFKVIEVKFDDDSVKSFASQYEDHILNQPLPLAGPDENLDPSFVLRKYRSVLSQKLESKLQDNDELVQIAGRWFPRSLLVDVNIGYLNLAEALLDEKGGGPLSTSTILQSIELPTDTNIKLTEFSLNYALQEDERFDEVGPTGEVLWFLHRLEPEAVLNQPPQLKYGALEYDYSLAIPYLKQFSQNIVDELEPLPEKETSTNANEAIITILYPHWRSGTLPLAANIANLIPSAYESPRVLFTFVDGNTGKTFGGWVVRSQHYIYGLSKWYEENEIIPGSLIQIKKGNKPGEVIITAQKKRPTKEYIHTTLVGADGGVVFALLKQNVSTTIDERMAIAVPDPEILDKVWQQSRGGKPALEKTIHQVMNNMIKLSPQGNVHAEELYAALNTVRRCPPALMLSILLEKPWAKHLGDLYFRIDESTTIGGNDE
jgi:hypothetical protein